VKVGDCISIDTKLSFGVPQGSILGPTLFLIYINSLCQKLIPYCEIITYADDTALILHGENWNEVRIRTEVAIREVMQWLRCNLLTLNVAKTKYISFSLSSVTQPSADFIVRAHTCEQPKCCTCPEITKTFGIKYLGLAIDSFLNWNLHINSLVGRVRKLIPVFRKLRISADRETLICVYYALAQSILQYCIVA
jgi:hypothetical protein